MYAVSLEVVWQWLLEFYKKLIATDIFHGIKLFRDEFILQGMETWKGDDL